MTACDDDWPFDQPRNCAVFTVWPILRGGRPITYVSHDQDDHGWQFLADGAFRMADAAVVSLEEIVHLDASVLQVADLPPGWHATRRSPSDAWVRHESPRPPADGE